MKTQVSKLYKHRFLSDLSFAPTDDLSNHLLLMDIPDAGEHLKESNGTLFGGV